MNKKYYLDNIGKRELVSSDEKYSIRNVDQLNKASDYKRNKKRRKFMKEEYVRRLILQTKKSKKSRRLFQKLHKTRKNPIKKIKKMSIKQIEDTYYRLLEADKPHKTRRRKKRKKKRRKRSTKK
tara:strand:+ start:393 stop:764 length:372 start_codon:yes stop_codon:yes gene_type:complete